MKKIIKPKGTGKTTDLIAISAEKNWHIVCSSFHECSRIRLQANQMGVNIPFPITYDELIDKKYYGKGVRGFLIDDVERLLDHIAGNVHIMAFTITR